MSNKSAERNSLVECGSVPGGRITPRENIRRQHHFIFSMVVRAGNSHTFSPSHKPMRKIVYLLLVAIIAIFSHNCETTSTPYTAEPPHEVQLCHLHRTPLKWIGVYRLNPSIDADPDLIFMEKVKVLSNRIPWYYSKTQDDLHMNREFIKYCLICESESQRIWDNIRSSPSDSADGGSNSDALRASP